MQNSNISASPILKQDYSKYSEEDKEVWKILFNRQTDILSGMASTYFLKGLETIHFGEEQIPDFSKTNILLAELTGWELIAVPGIVADDYFFRLLAAQKFPATTWLRSLKSLDYLEEPDMFHDVFAHVPLLTNQAFVDFLKELGKLGLEYAGQEWPIQLLSRIYWFSVEFGLILESGDLKIYGAGILSSLGESNFSLSKKSKKLAFDVENILDTAYRKDIFQEKYFVINAYEQLFHSLEAIRHGIKKRL